MSEEYMAYVYWRRKGAMEWVLIASTPIVDGVYTFDFPDWTSGGSLITVLKGVP